MARSRKAPRQLSLLAANVLLMIGLAGALQFEMQTQTKCILEEINSNVIVVGDYSAANRDNPGLPIYVDVKVGQGGKWEHWGSGPWHRAQQHHRSCCR